MQCFKGDKATQGELAWMPGWRLGDKAWLLPKGELGLRGRLGVAFKTLIICKNNLSPTDQRKQQI